jgi:hypothetical protein
MSISVLDPLNPAFARTKLMLFEPFDFTKWLKLGFCSFLTALGGRGGVNVPNFPAGSGGGGGGRGGGGEGPDFDAAFDWLRQNAALIIAIVAAIIFVVLVLGLLLTWLSSRGHFMFLDGIVKNRGAVAEPWQEYAREANSLFLFRICLGLGALVGMLLIAGIGLLLALPDISARTFGAMAVIAIIVSLLAFVAFSLAIGAVGMCLSQFVVPIMYLRRIKVMAAWSVFNQEMLKGRLTTFLIYFLFQIVIGIVVSFIALAATCLTCCVAAIPYVGSVILLPLYVFCYTYPLYFIEQFGPEWRVFPDVVPMAQPAFPQDWQPPPPK